MADQLGKKPFPILIVFIPITLLLVGLAGYFFWTASQAVKTIQSVSSQLETAKQEKATVSKELVQIKTDLETLQKNMDEALKDLDAAKSAKSSAEQALQAKTDEMTKLQATYQKKINDLEAEVKKYADFSAALSMELKPIKDVLGANQQVGSGGITSQTPAGEFPAAVQSIDLVVGKVTTINKEYGFALINIGSKNAAVPGRNVKIYQGDEQVGIGEIEKSQADTSAVSIVSKDLLERLHPGDKVVLI